MELDTKELFDYNFDFAFKAVTYNNMRVALRVFEQFKKKNEEFLLLIKEKHYMGI